MHPEAIRVTGLESDELVALGRRAGWRVVGEQEASMNPLLTAVIGAIARWLITIAAAQGVILSDDQSLQIVSGVVAASMLLWSLVNKKKTDTAIKDAKAGY